MHLNSKNYSLAHKSKFALRLNVLIAMEVFST